MTADLGLPSGLPKVPAPDPEHQKAVARSAAGRVIGFARGYTLAIGGFLVATVALDQFVAYYFEPWLPAKPLRILFVLGIPILAAIGLYLSQRTRARPSLFVQTEKAKPGYFRIGSYEEIAKDRADFRRADGEHECVLDWLERAPGAPLYLTGDSGTGKSSLLQAFVIPALREKGWAVQIERTLDDPEAAACRALAAPAAEKTGSRRGAAKSAPGRLVVLDQFEEFAILQESTKPDALGRFQASLRRLSAEPMPELRLLLVLRDAGAAPVARAP